MESAPDNKEDAIPSSRPPLSSFSSLITSSSKFSSKLEQKAGVIPVPELRFMAEEESYV